MSIDVLEYTPRGDKKNSEFFEEFRIKIYERRKSSGIEDLVGTMTAIVTQVEPGESMDTMLEMYLMTPYRHVAIEVKDGDHLSGQKNVDFVTNALKERGIPFLADVVGECTDEPNLKQIFSKHSKKHYSTNGICGALSWI